MGELGTLRFLLVINDDHAPILHGYGCTRPQTYWGHDLDVLGSHDVIGYVIIGSAYPEYPILEPSRKWIRCSAEESEDVNVAKNLRENKVLSLTRREPIIGTPLPCIFKYACHCIVES